MKKQNVDEETKMDELTNKADEDWNQENQCLCQQQHSGAAMISIHNDVSQYDNMTGHTTRA
jgi:hypothetical protein